MNSKNFYKFSDKLTIETYIESCNFFKLVKTTLQLIQLEVNNHICIECSPPSVKGTSLTYRATESKEEFDTEMKRLDNILDDLSMKRIEEMEYLLNLTETKIQQKLKK